MFTSRFLKPFGAALAVALLGELPCLVRTALISARTPEFWPVFLGTFVGTLSMMVTAIFLGEEIGSRIPAHILRVAGGLGLMLFGILILTGRFD